MTRGEAFRMAKAMTKETGKPAYVVYSIGGRQYEAWNNLTPVWQNEIDEGNYKLIAIVKK